MRRSCLVPTMIRVLWMLGCRTTGLYSTPGFLQFDWEVTMYRHPERAWWDDGPPVGRREVPR